MFPPLTECHFITVQLERCLLLLILQIFCNEADLNTPQMIDTFSLGEKVRTDPKLTKKRKDEVDEHLNSLTARWDRVKDFMALRKERYVLYMRKYKVITIFRGSKGKRNRLKNGTFGK